MSIWITPLLSLIGAMLGAAVMLLIHLRVTKEQYRKLTFEQRLKAHQEAISLCYELYRTLSKENQDEKSKFIRKIELWWESNCLSLDPKSRKALFMLTGDAYEHIYDYTENKSHIWKAIRETRDFIADGIGQEHLPEKEKDKALGIFGSKTT
jgi:hypothetical protein